jgi:hypothetical protein
MAIVRLMKERFWFRGMGRFVKRMIKGCLQCQNRHIQGPKRGGKLFQHYKHKDEDDLFDSLFMDHITMTPTPRGNNHLLVFHLFGPGITKFIPVTDLTAETTATAWFDRVYRNFGLHTEDFKIINLRYVSYVNNVQAM